MEAMFEGDDLERAALVNGAVFAGELDRAFDAFGAGIGEEHLIKQLISTSTCARSRLGPL